MPWPKTEVLPGPFSGWVDRLDLGSGAESRNNPQPIRKVRWRKLQEFPARKLLI